MAKQSNDKPKKQAKLKCPLPEEQKENLKEVADVVEKHRNLLKKFIG